jgi:hypothetical protein
MKAPYSFPVKVQWTKEYLANSRAKQRHGMAVRMTRGHDGCVTVKWIGVKTTNVISLDFLEEVIETA